MIDVFMVLGNLYTQYVLCITFLLKTNWSSNQKLEPYIYLLLCILKFMNYLSKHLLKHRIDFLFYAASFMLDLQSL